MNDFELPTTRVPVEVAESIRKALVRTESVCVAEGLPHQVLEKTSLSLELKRDDITWIGGFPFYLTKVMEAGDLITVKRIFEADQSYCEFSGEKRCGGFHPDHAIVWPDRFTLLVCFGCREVILFSGGDSY